MTLEERARLRALADAATRGPWKWDGYRVPTLEGRAGEPGEYEWDTEVLEASHDGECGCRSACTLELAVSEADAEFIAAAREAVPALLGVLDEVDDYARERYFVVNDGHSARDLGYREGHNDARRELRRLLGIEEWT